MNLMKTRVNIQDEIIHIRFWAIHFQDKLQDEMRIIPSIHWFAKLVHHWKTTNNYPETTSEKANDIRCDFRFVIEDRKWHNNNNGLFVCGFTLDSCLYSLVGSIDASTAKSRTQKWKHFLPMCTWAVHTQLTTASVMCYCLTTQAHCATIFFQQFLFSVNNSRFSNNKVLQPQ